jgi:2-hydroxychromene-2-carboxylate isomerase
VTDVQIVQFVVLLDAAAVGEQTPGRPIGLQIVPKQALRILRAPIRRSRSDVSFGPMPAAIDVFFEFSSPYSYLAAQELPPLAARHGRELRWRPIELAKVWEAQGVLEPYKAIRKLKASYIFRDAVRVAIDRGVRLIPYQAFPNVTHARLAVHRLNRRFASVSESFVLQTWRKLFAESADIGLVETLTRGLDAVMAAEVMAAGEDPEADLDLKTANREAIASGCFGVPWILADGDVYWGQDRLYLLDRRLGART